MRRRVLEIAVKVGEANGTEEQRDRRERETRERKSRLVLKSKDMLRAVLAHLRRRQQRGTIHGTDNRKKGAGNVLSFQNEVARDRKCHARCRLLRTP
eukprot:scaffold24322_cov81-Phaeocystis_antarctica.AAC.1